MGNQHGKKHHKIKRGGEEEDATAVPSTPETKQGKVTRLLRKAVGLDRVSDDGIAVGDKFVTWHSSRLKDVSYMEGTVVDIFEQPMDVPLFEGNLDAEIRDGTSRRAAVSRKPRSRTYVVLEYPNHAVEELTIHELRSSVARAQQALKTEKEWGDRLAAAGFSKGSTVELWVAEEQLRSPSTHSPGRTRSSSSSNAGPVVAGLDHDNKSKDDDGPGDIWPYLSKQVHIGWHYQEIVVEVDLARLDKRDGFILQTETLSFDVAETRRQQAVQASTLLNREVRFLADQHGIFVNAKVDLWITDLRTNVRGVVTEIDHRFLKVSEVSRWVIASWIGW